MNRINVPILVFSVLGIAVAFLPMRTRPAPPVGRTIRIEAADFAFAPAEISVNPGDRVTIEFVSADVVHGLYIDGYDLALESDPGRPARLTFTAEQSGSFRFRCSVTCGALHPFMIGRLNVGPNTALYRALALVFLSVGAVLAWPRARAGA
jgi:heme/copper-type cytochrome/quinol oxidase subunit 2